MSKVNNIKESRKTARKLSKEKGSSYQSELNAIALSHGHSNWGAFLRAQGTEQESHGNEVQYGVLIDLPNTRRGLEKYAKDLSHTIIPLHQRLQESDYEFPEHGALAGLILVEISRARDEGRNASIHSLRYWMTSEIEKAAELDEKDRRRAISEGKLYSGDRQVELFKGLAKTITESQPYGRAYAEMTRLASMKPNERLQILMKIIPALSDYIDDEFEKA